MSADVLTPREREVLMAAATAAPSLHNSQPWLFTVSGRQVSVYADPERQLRQADPHGRQLLISCGAALFNLRLAAIHLGLEPRVRLLPDWGDTRLIARVDVTGHRKAPGLFELMYEAIPLRHTNRHPFEDCAVPGAAVDALVEAARLEGADLVVPHDRAGVVHLAEVVRLGTEENDHNPALLAEAADWTDVDAERRDGVPGYALGPLPDDPGATVRDLRRGTPVPGRPEATFERMPLLVVLVTRTDDREAWVRAGQALQRVLLTATLHGLSASFVNQPLEVPSVRRSVLGSGDQRGHPQMLLRLGLGMPVPPTPRRTLDDVMGESHQ